MNTSNTAIVTAKKGINLITTSLAKGNAIKKLSHKWDDLVGEIIYLVTFRKSVKGEWNPKENPLLPGQIYMEISEYKIKKNNKLKKVFSGINSNIFFSNSLKIIHYLFSAI